MKARLPSIHTLKHILCILLLTPCWRYCYCLLHLVTLLRWWNVHESYWGIKDNKVVCIFKRSHQENLILVNPSALIEYPTWSVLYYLFFMSNFVEGPSASLGTKESAKIFHRLEREILWHIEYFMKSFFGRRIFELYFHSNYRVLEA